MKIALFDQVNETHVCDALAVALRALGHEILETGPVWQGHRFPVLAEDTAGIDEMVETVLSAGCEALFNFRASALSPDQLSRLRRAGVTTAIWLPDDPVLYGVTYRHVVDEYDHVLHCGSSEILEFYSGQGHKPGINFPFWLDPGIWSYVWEPECVQRALVFLGNLHGPAKRGRYERLAPGYRSISVYGICPTDPLGMHVGELHGIEALKAVLPLYRAGLNLPQRFAEYAGSAYDFAGLSALGGFELPSRVIQYAALGLPVISLGGLSPNEAFPHSLKATDVHAALRISDGLAHEADAAIALSRLARSDVERHFSGASRAMLLVALLSGAINPAAMSLHDRATCYRQFSTGNC
jgi:hypothetical protein